VFLGDKLGHTWCTTSLVLCAESDRFLLHAFGVHCLSYFSFPEPRFLEFWIFEQLQSTICLCAAHACALLSVCIMCILHKACTCSYGVGCCIGAQQKKIYQYCTPSLNVNRYCSPASAPLRSHTILSMISIAVQAHILLNTSV